MLRVRLVAVGFLVVFIAGFGFLPVVLGYTFWAGKQGVARITACEQRTGTKGPRRLDCSGQWRAVDGGTGSGHISGVDKSDVGRSVAVRIGPLGPYAGGFARSWPLFLTALPILFFPPVTLVFFVRTLGPARATARRLLAAPPDGATLLRVDAKRARPTRSGDPEYGALRETPAPPGFQPVHLPGVHPLQSQESVFTAVAGITRDTTDFATVFGPAGEPLLVLERRGFRANEPETWLLDPAGTARAVVRRVQWHPARFELLGADGARLGQIATLPKSRSSCFETRDERGRQLAVMAASGRGWVARIEPNTPPLLRDLTLVFLFDSGRLQL